MKTLKTWYATHHSELASFVAGYLFFSAVLCGMKGDWLLVAANSICIFFSLKWIKWF